MRYIYTNENCPNCEKLKKYYIENEIAFIERSADRLKSPEDAIDLEGLVTASLQNMTLPVEVTNAD